MGSDLFYLKYRVVPTDDSERVEAMLSDDEDTAMT